MVLVKYLGEKYVMGNYSFIYNFNLEKNELKLIYWIKVNMIFNENY